MTIYEYGSFAWIPKRCEYCGRLFWLEPFDFRTKLVGLDQYPLKRIKCKFCLEKEKHNYI